MPKRKTAEKKTPLKSQYKDKLYILFCLVLILVGVQANNSSHFNLHSVKKEPVVAVKKQVIKDEEIKISNTLLQKVKPINIPKEIIIPSAAIDLPVVEAPVVDGYWEVSETSASHGLGSSYPGGKGNSVIFAHAREGLFYNLKDVKMADKIYVLTNNKWYEYKVSKITSVFPDQVQVVSQTKDDRLTLYTCTGYADEKRLIVVATPIKEKVVD